MPELAMTKEEYRRRTGLEPTGPVMPMPGQPTMPQGEPPLVQALSKVGGMLGQAANTQQQVPIEKVAPQIYPSGLMPEQVTALQNAQAGREQQAASINLSREEMAQRERGQQRYLGAQQQQQERNIQADQQAAQVRRQQELEDQKTKLADEEKLMRLQKSLNDGEWQIVNDASGTYGVQTKDGKLNVEKLWASPNAPDLFFDEGGKPWMWSGEKKSLIPIDSSYQAPRKATGGGAGRGTQAERDRAELGMTARQKKYYDQLMEDGVPEPEAYAEAMGQGAQGGTAKEGRVAVYDSATNSIVYKTQEEIAGKGATQPTPEAKAPAPPTQTKPFDPRKLPIPNAEYLPSSVDNIATNAKRKVKAFVESNKAGSKAITEALGKGVDWLGEKFTNKDMSVYFTKDGRQLSVDELKGINIEEALAQGWIVKGTK